MDKWKELQESAAEDMLDDDFLQYSPEDMVAELLRSTADLSQGVKRRSRDVVCIASYSILYTLGAILDQYHLTFDDVVGYGE